MASNSRGFTRNGGKLENRFGHTHRLVWAHCTHHMWQCGRRLPLLGTLVDCGAAFEGMGCFEHWCCGCGARVAPIPWLQLWASEVPPLLLLQLLLLLRKLSLPLRPLLLGDSSEVTYYLLLLDGELFSRTLFLENFFLDFYPITGVFEDILTSIFSLIFNLWYFS